MFVRRSPLILALAATMVAGFLLAALGPFGTYLNGAFPQRLAYWLATSLLGLVLYGGMVGALTRLRRAGWKILLLGSLLASVPESWLSHELALRLWSQLGSHGPSLILWYGQSALIGGFWTLILARLLTPPSRPDEPLPQAASGDKIGDLLGEDVLALQIEDHYVRIHRAEGSRMVLMPLGQAIAALDAGKGLQTHRSWWVARDAVVEVKGSPRAMKLILRNGLEAPVARSAVARLRAAGWIDRA
jgi:hypothetical protein